MVPKIRLIWPETILVLFFVASEIREYGYPIASVDPTVRWLAIDYISNIVVIAFVLLVPILRQSVRTAVALRQSRYESSLYALIRLLAIVVGLSILQITLSRFGIWLGEVLPDIRPDHPVYLGEPFFTDDVLVYVMWFDLTVGLILVSISEEFVFRGVAYAALKRHNLSNVAIILVSSILFGLIHLGDGLSGIIAKHL